MNLKKESKSCSSLFSFESLRMGITFFLLHGQLLLGYLPQERGLWLQELNKKRSQYKAFKGDFLLNPVSLLDLTQLIKAVDNQ